MLRIRNGRPIRLLAALPAAAILFLATASAPSARVASAAPVPVDITRFLDDLPILRAAAHAEAQASLDFGGMWFDQTSGNLVLAFASVDKARDEKVLSLLPSAIRSGTRVEVVKHSLASLRRYHEQARSLLGHGINGVALDIRGNGLMVMSEDEALARQLTGLQGLTDVPIVFLKGSNSEDTCSSRASCGGTSARRGGVRIVAHGATCTSGLIADYFGARYAVTAGHCWYGWLSGSVTSGGQSFGTLNSDNAYFHGSFCDCRLVPTTAGVTAGARVYFSTASPYLAITSKIGLGNLGDSVRLSGQYTQSSGTISYVDYAYIGEACGCELIGSALATYGSTGGDSGGSITSTNGVVAKGIHSGNSGGYGRFFEVTRIQDALDVTVMP